LNARSSPAATASGSGRNRAGTPAIVDQRVLAERLYARMGIQRLP
jgi:hypothetical protein